MPNSHQKNRSRGIHEREAIARDFRPLLARLRRLEHAYNPENQNLHWDVVVNADRKLFERLERLAREGLRKVRKHHAYFLSHDLYDDGMFWYDLLLLISAAARGVLTKAFERIPLILAKRLAVIVTDLSEYTVLGGDMTLRNRETLANLLLAFPSDSLRVLLLGRGKQLDNQAVMQFLQHVFAEVQKVQSFKEE